MKNKIILLVLLGFFCMGMAGTGGFGPGSTESERLFRADVTDVSDKTYQVEKISVEGSTHLPARIGSAEATVDFGKVRTVRFYLQDEQVLARVTFFNDEEADFYIHPNTRFAGLTDWGRITFQARDVREIRFR